MTKVTQLSVIILLITLLFSGCDDGGILQEDVAEAYTALSEGMLAARCCTPDTVVDGDSCTITYPDFEGIQFAVQVIVSAGGAVEGTAVIVFDNFYHAATGYTITGTINGTVLYGNIENLAGLSIKLTGELVLSGGKIETLELDYTLEGMTAIGTVTANGLTWNVSELN